ncbi:hypothetical protein AC1031_021683 [Aphanomyces cochlioides]|nr:hypothetical protein AC1031_021683 [Aphanomyces cochlioides]
MAVFVRSGSEEEDGNEQLYGAALSGDLANVRSRLILGADVNWHKQATRATALHVASSEGHLEVVEELISHGATVDVTDKDGQTPLHLAAQNGHAHVVKMLLDHGATADAVRHVTRDTPLHLAAMNKHLAVVQELLAHGANADAGDWTHRGALYLAAHRGRVDIVKELLAHGASVDIITRVRVNAHSVGGIYSVNQPAREISSVLRCQLWSFTCGHGTAGSWCGCE